MKAFDYLDFHARQQPEAEFARCSDQRICYSKAQEMVHRVANGLIACGLKPGDRIALLMKNSIEMVMIYFGAFKAGVIPTPMNHRLKPTEWKRISTHAEAKLLVCDAQFAEDVDAIRDQLDDLRSFLHVSGSRSGWLDFAAWTAQQPRDAPGVGFTEEHDIWQMYTSGTTGTPRRAVTTHRAVTACISQLGLVAPLQPMDRFLLIMPLFHAAGIIAMLHAISWGASLLLQKQFTAEQTVAALDNKTVTVTMMVPTMIQTCLTEVPDIASRKFEKLRLMIYGASTIHEETIRQAMQVFRCDFAQRYGTTETLSLTWLSPSDHRLARNEKPKLFRSAGRPLPGTQIRVVDADKRAVPAGVHGEFMVSGPQLICGNWKSDDATNCDQHGEFWMKTGDAGFVDQDGYVYICDRVKDLIVSGGENIYPHEIEDVLLEHPDVREVAVIGVPDLKWGESVKAIIAIRKGARTSEQQLIDYCRGRLDGLRLPQSVEFVPAIPRNSSGKVLKSELREPYWQGHGRRV